MIHPITRRVIRAPAIVAQRDRCRHLPASVQVGGDSRALGQAGGREARRQADGRAGRVDAGVGGHGQARRAVQLGVDAVGGGRGVGRGCEAQRPGARRRLVQAIGGDVGEGVGGESEVIHAVAAPLAVGDAGRRGEGGGHVTALPEGQDARAGRGVEGQGGRDGRAGPQLATDVGSARRGDRGRQPGDEGGGIGWDAGGLAVEDGA